MAAKVGITKMWVNFQYKWQSSSPWNAESIGSISGAWCPDIVLYLSWVSPICPDIQGQIKRKPQRNKAAATTTKQNPQNTWLKTYKILPRLCVSSTLGLPWWLRECAPTCAELWGFQSVLPVTTPPWSQQPPKIATLTLGAVALSHEYFGYCHIYLLCLCGRGSSDLVLQLQFSCLNVTVIVALIIAVLVLKIRETRGIFCMIWLFLKFYYYCYYLCVKMLSEWT